MQERTDYGSDHQKRSQDVPQAEQRYKVDLIGIDKLCLLHAVGLWERVLFLKLLHTPASSCLCVSEELLGGETQYLVPEPKHISETACTLYTF